MTRNLAWDDTDTSTGRWGKSHATVCVELIVKIKDRRTPWVTYVDLFIIADKARANFKGKDIKRGCRCYERLEVKAGGFKALTHRWSGERGYLRSGKWIGGEIFVSRRGECASEKLYSAIQG